MNTPILRNNLARGLAAMSLGLALSLASADAGAIDDLKIVAPAKPGGGWDQTARSMQEVLQAAGIAKAVTVENIAGAGGTVGLAQFVDQDKRQRQRPAGQRAGDGRRHPDQPVGGDAGPGDADRAPDRRV